MTEQKVDLSQYKDKYAEELGKLVEAKVQGKEIVASPPQEPELIVNLMEALQKSLDKAKAKAEPPKIVAPSSAQRGAATAAPDRVFREGRSATPHEWRRS
jgi:non-homologous end joining protein Ku